MRERLLHTGFADLDEALGGGYMQGRVVELAARLELSHILSALAFGAVRAAHQRGERATYVVDTAGRLTPETLRSQRIDPANLSITQPEGPLSETLRNLAKIIDTGALDLVIVAATMPGRVDDAESKRTIHALRPLTAAAYRGRTTVLVLHAFEANGVGCYLRSGLSETALRYYATQRVHVTRGVPESATLRVTKNRNPEVAGSPFRTVEVPFTLPVLPHLEVSDAHA